MVFNRLALFSLIFSIQQSSTQVPPVVPLTNALTAVYCHNSDEPGIMTIRCGPNEKIRMLDAFDAAVGNRSSLPIQCLTGKDFSKNRNTMDCKVQTSFTSACSGRENCTLHMQRLRLNNPDKNCQNEFVDYTMAFFECISDVSIHDVCSPQAITSAWGTLQTPNFPNPYTSNDDCWCKLSTQVQHRLLLSIIVFQLIPYDQHCAGAGLYIQSSNAQRSTQCTYLQQGHNYLSDTNTLYINFYSRTSTVRGGFWIIYEASHPNAEVHLHCGSREKIGVPIVSNSVSPPSVSTSYDHGWSRLAFNNPPNPTTPFDNYRMRLAVTTPRSSININSKITTSATVGAFTYPYGALATFDLAYGPSGWYLKQPAETTNRTLPTTPVVKWNFTWLYTHRPRTKLSTMTSTVTMTTEPTTTTTKRMTTTTLSTPTTTTRLATPHQRLLFTHKPWIYHNFSTSQSSRTHPTTKKFIISSSALSSIGRTTIPYPTPWYPQDGPFGLWTWKRHETTTKTSTLKTSPITLPSTTPRTSTTFHPPARTTTTTRWIPTTIATTTTTKSTTHSIERTRTMTNSTRHASSVSWITWSSKQPVSNRNKPSHYINEVYNNEHYIQRMITSTVKTSSPVSVSPRQRYQQIDLLPVSPNWQMVTINTPPVKRYHSQQNIGVNERNSGGNPNNGQVTVPNVHNMIRRVMEPRNKKSSIDYGWLSKTDMTIVAVSVLFVILLAIINLILFAVRRHRHRTQGRHLLSTSIPSLLDERKLGGVGPPFGDVPNELNNITNNNNNNDILPAVGEIVIWDEKDQGGYMIDNNGAWAKIEGRQWFGGNLFRSCTKTSLSKSFRSHFRFMRHLDKKTNQQHQVPMPPKMHHIQQQTFKFPLLMDTATLSPVPEGDDYDSSELSLSDVVIRSSATTTNHPSRREQKQLLMKSNRKQDFLPQYQQNMTKALIHTDPQQSDDYYKRIGTSGDESNYTSMPENGLRDFSLADQETDRSLGNEIDSGGPFVVCVPTMMKQDDDMGTNIDGGDSIYNPHYSIQTLDEYSHPNYLQPNNRTGPFSTKPSISTFKPTMNNSVIVGFCQGEFQPLDPKLLFKSTIDHQEFYRSSQPVPLSTNDSGFVDDQTVGSFTATNALSGSDNILISEGKDDHMTMDDIFLTKSEDDEDDDDLPLNGLAKTQLRNSNQQKWRHGPKHVSFQEEHVTQRFSPPPSSFNTLTNPDTTSNPFDTYDVATQMIQTVPIIPSLFKPFLPPSTIASYYESSPTTSSLFTVQKPATSIDNDDNTNNVIMNHLHSVKSLKKFFETKMVVQQPLSSALTTASCAPSISLLESQTSNRSSMIKEKTPPDEIEQRQEMMDKVLGSLKTKRVYSQTTNDTAEPNGRYSAMTTSSYDSTLTQNLPVQRHYSRRFRSSSTSNNSAYPGGNIITHINLSNSHHNKRAHSQERQHYQTTNHHFDTIDKWKQEQEQQPNESDEDDNISENSMLWQARTKLNQFVRRTRRNQQQSPYYTTCTNGGTPSEDLYTYDDNESVTVETRF